MSAAAEPFATPEQERRAAMLGIAVFLASEVLLFGGLLAALLFTRFAHPAGVVAASKELHLWIGAANTVVLLSSSFAAALASTAAKLGRDKATAGLLALTAVFGLAFLALKSVEYGLEFRDGMLPVAGGDAGLDDPVARLFMGFYLVGTGLHAVHLTAGILLLLFTAARVWSRGIALPRRATAVEAPVMYWHLVDVIWVFLYPALYLAR